MTGYSKVFLDIAPRMDCLDNDVDFGEVEFPDQKKAVRQIGLSAERKLCNSSALRLAKERN